MHYASEPPTFTTMENETRRCELKKRAKSGQHFWATYKATGKIVMVMKSYNYHNIYEVCGPWECGIKEDEISLIERVYRPKGYENTLHLYR